MDNKEIVAIQPFCVTCGWEGKRYVISTEGNVDFARTSAIIETRLGHLLDTKGTHKIEYREIKGE
ncbi:MAG TPA: hypothetical protein PK045_00765 [Candidatus Woesebacteria bacterium]|nr:hypothetical protein [Candidatus Woesebacteria bacterium]